MSLDDVIARKEKSASTAGNKRNNGKKTGPARGPPKKQTPARQAAREDRPRREIPVQNAARTAQVSSNRQNLSVFARIGKPPVSGTSVTFANLKSSVAEKDIEDLCGAVGEVKEVELTNGRSGRNTAKVLFARRSDALTCVTKLNGKRPILAALIHGIIRSYVSVFCLLPGMTLDGFPMEVSVTGEPAEFTAAPKSVFDRLQPVQQNVRSGLFGTAIESDDNDSSSGPSFSVTLGGNADSFGRQTKLVQPFAVGSSNSHGASKGGIVQPFAANSSNRREKDHGEGPRFLFRDEGDQQSTRGIRQPFERQDRPRSAGNFQDRRDKPNNRRDNAPRGNRSGNNNNKDRGNQRPERQAKPAASASDLDADLDAYFSK